jgi:hypothetical protein
MKRGLLSILLGTALLVAGGCKSKTENQNAIRDGVVKHIAGMNGLNVNNMTITVTKADIHGDTAEADVDIRPRNSDPSAPPMQLVYQMQKQGTEWVVVKGEAKGGMQHPAPGEMPPQGSLPPGHPSTGGTSGQLPDNHPDFNSILNTAQPQGGQQPPAQQQPQSNSQQQPQQKSSTGSYKP